MANMSERKAQAGRRSNVGEHERTQDILRKARRGEHACEACQRKGGQVGTWPSQPRPTGLLKTLGRTSTRGKPGDPTQGGQGGRNFDTLQKLESSVQSLMQNIWQLQELADAHRSQGT